MLVVRRGARECRAAASGCQSRGAKSPVHQVVSASRASSWASAAGAGRFSHASIDLDEQGLAAQADKGRGQQVVAGVAEDDKARAVRSSSSRRSTKTSRQRWAHSPATIRLRIAGNHHAAFVELGQRIAQGAARRFRRRDGQQ
jgi:biotin carboxyl carrier protein